MNRLAEASEALVIVVKYPEVGAVKTRLARYLGDERACQLYLSFIRDLEEKFGDRPRPLYWAYTPPESDFPSLVNSGCRCFPQEGAWLGERLLNIFRRLFHEGFQRVAIMSSDAPQMLTEWIEEAFASLSEADAVFAPAEDGGYNLVGLKQIHDLFSDISMSTPRVLADTLERARTLGLSVHLLPTSFDVDEIEDLEKLRRFLAQNGEPLPHTREILKQIGEAMGRQPRAGSSFSLGLGLTNDCDLACAHCYRETLRIDRLSLEDVKAACESLPIRSVNLGTGENALHPQFLEILEYLQSQDVKLTITSNGHSASVLNDDQLRYFDAIEFSLDFATQAAQDAFRGPGNWRLILEQIERCQRLDIPVTITAVMMSINYDKLADVARLAASLGATFRVNVYQSVKTDAFALSYDQFWTGFKKLFAASVLLICNEPIVRAVLGIKEPRRGGCGQSTVRVTPRGEVLPCVYWPEEALRLSDLVRQGEHVVDTDLFRRLATVPEFCRSCEFVESCAGGCAGRRRLRGKLDEPDEFCPFVRGETIDLPCEVVSGREFPKAASACTVIVEGKTY